MKQVCWALVFAGCVQPGGGSGDDDPDAPLGADAGRLDGGSAGTDGAVDASVTPDGASTADAGPVEDGSSGVDGGPQPDGAPLVDEGPGSDGAPVDDASAPDGPLADGSAPADLGPVPDACSPVDEACNGVDDDCDGVVDEMEPAACQRPSPGDALDWVRIEGGDFVMGHERSERSRPPHDVRVGDFDIARSEVTNAQYRACVDAGVCRAQRWDGGHCWVTIDGQRVRGSLVAAARAPERPATCVDWYDARTFAAWVGGRLPSEAEWEFAARSRGQEIAYPWGDDEIGCDRALINGCMEGAPGEVCQREDGHSAQGVCDLIGNVGELIEDWVHDGYVGAPADGSVWSDPPGDRPVVRGASFVSGRRLFSTSRSSANPEHIADNVGFRVARTAGAGGCMGAAVCEAGEIECADAEGACGGPVQACGDEAVGPGEQCDDGNDDACDACELCRRRAHLRLEAVEGHWVRMADDESLRLAGVPFTIEFWARLDEEGERVDVSRRGAPNVGWRLSVHSDRVSGGAFGGESVGAAVAIRGRGWVHVAWSYDGQASRVFVGGALIDEREPAPDEWIRPVDVSVHINALRNGDGVVEHFSAGRIDELHISSMARYVAAFQPARRLEPDAGTLGLWHFDRYDRGNVVDASARGRTALMHDAVLVPGSAGLGCELQ